MPTCTKTAPLQEITHLLDDSKIFHNINVCPLGITNNAFISLKRVRLTDTFPWGNPPVKQKSAEGIVFLLI